MRVVDGRQIRAARAILGMTTKEAAAAAKVNRNTVWRVEALEGIEKGAFAPQRLGQTFAGMGVVCDVEKGKAVVRFPVAGGKP